MKDNKTKIILSIAGILAVLIAVIGVSYAAFNYFKPGDNPNTVTSGTLKLTYDESKGEAITLEKATPMTDATGLKGEPYQFTIENTGTLPSDYKIKLIRDPNDTTASEDLLPANKLKIALTKNGTTQTPVLLSTTEDGVIEIGRINAGEKNNYELRMWIDYSAGNEVFNKAYQAVVQVIANQTNMD